jgi:methyl-accepting chemotaxis protein
MTSLGVRDVDFLTRFRIGPRLLLLLVGVLLFTAAVAASGIWGLNALFGITSRVLGQDVALAHNAQQIQTLVLQERRFEKDAFINLADEGKRSSYVKKWNDARGRLEQAIAATRPLADEAEDAQSLQRMQDSLHAYAGGFEQTLAGIAAGRITTTQDANAEITKFKEFVHGLETASDAMAERAMKRAGTAIGQVDAVRSRTSLLQLLLAGIGMTLAALCCWAVARSIVLPINKAVTVAQKVAAGDLASRIEARGSDEAAALLRALAGMNENLARLVGQVRDAADSIATGSSQIAAGSIDLSQRTEEQASNLQQTASSMDQLTASVRHNADTAQQATVLAREATSVAEQGGGVVGEVVATMENIATSSHRIADIIGVIDGIAFQTNILALNAAVEAARAGEQGRGFAVVAGEVRSLAQRSAAAAKEIKSLIGESTDRVDAGTRLVADAGKTMHEIMQRVRRVNELIGEIGGATAEQSTGIGQIGSAVNQLDQVTQQNAALVEQSAAAAESLKHQAAALTQTVALFKLADAAAEAAYA